MSNSILKKSALIVFSVLQFLLLSLPGIGNISSNDIFEQPNIANPRIIPADYTFAIWGFIFPACVIYAIYIAFFQTNSEALSNQVSNWALLTFLTISVYDVVARIREISFLTAVIFFPVLYFLIRAILTFIKNKAISKYDYYFTVPALSVYAAWVSLATIVNVSSSLLKLGYRGQPIGEVALTIIVLILATPATIFVVRITRNKWYSGALIWAFTGVFVNGWQNNFGEVMLLSIIAILIILIVRVKNLEPV